MPTSSVRDLIPDLGEILDEPLANPSILPTLLVSQVARHVPDVGVEGRVGAPGVLGRGVAPLHDALHGRVATIPFLVLVERFHDSEVLHDFLEIFCEQALATLIPDTATGKKPQVRRVD